MEARGANPGFPFEAQEPRRETTHPSSIPRIRQKIVLRCALCLMRSRAPLTRVRFFDDNKSAQPLFRGGEESMASNRGVAYMGPGKVEIHSIDYPKLELGSRKCEHG